MGDTLRYTLKDLHFNTTYHFRIDAFDVSGNRSALSKQVNAQTENNSGPVITSLDGNATVLRMHEQKSPGFPPPIRTVMPGPTPSVVVPRIGLEQYHHCYHNRKQGAAGKYNAILKVEDLYLAQAQPRKYHTRYYQTPHPGCWVRPTMCILGYWSSGNAYTDRLFHRR